MGAYKFYLGDPTKGTEDELKHILSFSINVTRTTMNIGIPSLPPESSRIFPVAGPILTFNISAERIESEETKSNMDFIYGSTGLEAYVSRIQVTYPYKFRIVFDENLVGECTGKEIPTGTYMVSLTAFTTDMDSEVLGKLSYSLSLMQRRS